MKRLFVLLVPLLLLAGCVGAPVPPSGPEAGLPQPSPSCRIGPDGAPPTADRGIGGTGEPASRRADRGIGGTGGPPTRPSLVPLSDRGIGGTGITGIVTGFASVCIDGLEVALDDQVRIDIDGTPAPRAALRAGQMVAISAGSPNEAPRATRISVRHEVSGPVEAVLSVDPGLIVVAGQRVRVPVKAMGSVVVQPGVWLAVSGLRGPDGDIIATRLDPRSLGPLLVHGPLIEVDGVPAIGALEIRGASVPRDHLGTYVVTSGTYDDGVMDGAAVSADLLVSDPPAYFGPGTRRLVLESYARFGSGSAATSGGFRAGLAQGFQPPRDLTGPVILSLDAQPDGSFVVSGARVASRGATGSGAPPAASNPGGERPGGAGADPRAGLQPASSPAASPGGSAGLSPGATAETATPPPASGDTSMMGPAKAPAVVQVGGQAPSPGGGADSAPYVRAAATAPSVGIIGANQPPASASDTTATIASDPRTPARAAAQVASGPATVSVLTGSSASVGMPPLAATAGVILGGATQGGLAPGGAMSGGVIIQPVTPGVLTRGGGGAWVRGGGIRLAGPNIAHSFGHGAAALHLNIRQVRIGPRH